MIGNPYCSSSFKTVLGLNTGHENTHPFSQAVVQRCSVKKVFLKISQSSQENTCARVFFLIKFFLKKRYSLWHRCFPVSFLKFLTTLFYRTPLVVAAAFHSQISSSISTIGDMCKYIKNKSFENIFFIFLFYNILIAKLDGNA